MRSDAPGGALAAASLVLARRLHTGTSTLWCWSPEARSDADHVVVEFVHPVIVGKRAVPAAAVDSCDHLRRSARPGDVLLAIGRGDDEAIADAVRRTPAWGVEAVWLATGAPPPPDTNGSVVWLGEMRDRADVVCAYHVLWELVHVCFEHPAVLSETGDEPPSCPTCADGAEVGEVRSVGRRDEATVLIGGIEREIDLSLVGHCGPGDLVMVHAGVAITKMEPARSG